MLNDFKAFIARGNVLDLAIGVIIGAAFGKVITTFTEGIIMPIVGLLTGGVDFKTKVLSLGKLPVGTPEQIEAAKKAGEPLIMYGQLINDIIIFLIVALVMFFLARYAVKLFASLAAADAGPSPSEVLLAEIRDELKKSK